MKTHNIKSNMARPFVLTSLALAFSLISGQGFAATQTYTLDGDFDQGALTGINHDPNHNQLQLNITGSSFPVLWIANAGEDTLSKIDSRASGVLPGKELARYRTWFNSGTYAHDAWNGPAPSRTAVDAQGNAYVLDRWFGGYPTVFKILNEGFIDRNGNGVMDTSNDANDDGTIQLSEMMPLTDNNGNGIIDENEIQDERIAWVKRVPDGVYSGGITRVNGIGRALCIGTDSNLWVGLYNNAEYFKISSADGHTIAGPVATNGYPNYGCLIDQDGNLWGANWSYGVLTKITNTGSNTGPYVTSTIGMPSAVYGLALRRDSDDNETHVIMGGSGWSYVDYNANTGVTTTPADVFYGTYAVGTDNDGNILVSKTTGGVVKFNPLDGSVIWDKPSQVGSSDSRGVIADSDNNVWQVHRGSHNIAKYNGINGDFLGVKGVGYEPYTYSDASGTAQLSITTKTGNWDVVKDGGAAGTQWGTVSWTADVPTGASVVVEARASDNPVPSGSFTTVFNGTSISPTLTGRYLEVKVTLNANPQNQSPIVYDVSIASLAVAKCDVDTDGDIDKIDLSLISKARGKTPTTNDPRDSDGDGKITPNDVKVCTTKCTLTNCAVPTAPPVPL